MANERGVGNIVNVPLPPRSGGAQFRRAMNDTILPALSGFRPDFILVSAGFDAHREDPLANLEFTEEDFAWATQEILAVAKASCQGRVVSTLEGGYDLDALAASAGAHVRALMAAA
jgi:acetoin utilization deacetylase AcuC-like enzyme